MELAIFRMIQECLTNVHRHSGSISAKVRLSHDNDHHIRIEVKNQGKGIPPDKQADLNSSDRAGVRFRGMRERLRKQDKTFEVQSDAKGTIVIARVPLTIASDGTAAKSGSIN
jgi:two-component system NarL family sensor kinase